MRTALGWLLLVALVGCSASPESLGTGGAGAAGMGGEGGSGGEGGRTPALEPVRIVLISPSDRAVVANKEGRIRFEGRIESGAKVIEFSYRVDGKNTSLPAQRGPFSFDLQLDRAETSIELRAKSADGSETKLARIIYFDETDGPFGRFEYFRADRDVALQGEIVTLSWRITPGIDLLMPWWLVELNSRRTIDVTHLDSIEIKIQNPDLETWALETWLGPSPLVHIGVGETLRMLPEHAVLGVGQHQWISIANAGRAGWSVSSGGTVTPDGAENAIPAGASFSANVPGTYIVRARTSEKEPREGSVTIEVRELQSEFLGFREIAAALPSHFTPGALAAGRDGAMVVGGASTRANGSTLFRHERGSDEWTPLDAFDEWFMGGSIEYLAFDAGFDLFVSDGENRVARLPAEDGPAELLPDLNPSDGRKTVGFGTANGIVFALKADLPRPNVISFPWGFRWVTGAESWTFDDDLRCLARLVSVADGGIWNTCGDSAWKFLFHFDSGDSRWTLDPFPSIAGIIDIESDNEGGVVAATRRGIFRRPAGRSTWELFGGGGPSGASVQLRQGGGRFFAADDSGIYSLDRDAMSWVPLPGSPVSGGHPLLLATDDGRLVIGSASRGATFFESFEVVER